MAIPYSCPHCGKQFSVAEQFAGQTGPCAACGKPITIPLPAGSGAYAAAPAKSGRGMALVAFGVVGALVMLLACGGILLALLLPAVQAAREAARRMQSANNLKQLALAMQNYHDQYGALPPAVVRDENGKPLYSGRVLLLPYLESQGIYQQFDKAQAWDSPANQPLTQTALSVFRDASAPSPPAGQTDFLFVTGQGTAMEGLPEGRSIRFADITDGTSNTVFMVEVKNSGINWAEPRDLDISQPMSLPAGNHPGGNLAVFFDGHTQMIPKTVPPQQIRAMATRSGEERIEDF
jgi:type II secretory pathway pseudopilin PulG